MLMRKGTRSGKGGKLGQEGERERGRKVSQTGAGSKELFLIDRRKKRIVYGRDENGSQLRLIDLVSEAAMHDPWLIGIG